MTTYQKQLFFLIITTNNQSLKAKIVNDIVMPAKTSSKNSLYFHLFGPLCKQIVLFKVNFTNKSNKVTLRLSKMINWEMQNGLYPGCRFTKSLSYN